MRRGVWPQQMRREARRGEARRVGENEENEEENEEGERQLFEQSHVDRIMPVVSLFHVGKEIDKGSPRVESAVGRGCSERPSIGGEREGRW